ncbi:MAG: helix-turn-helix transcriptional regulator [Propionibacteriaceae bacterium]|nr:helix-turn-helix transcriptional regulator [Propionibacteriaceae bacterium]
MSTTPSVRVGANVRAEMARKGMTQTQLAGQIGITQAQISKRLSGQIAFDVNELVAVAAALDVTLPYLTMDATERGTTEAGVVTR